MITLLLLLGACGDVSNLPFAEDAEFTDAMPASDRTTVVVEDEETAAATARSAGVPLLLQYSYDYGVAINRYLFQILSYPDAVRSLPPSTRDEDSRGWGPFDGDGISIEATIHRTGEGRFDWFFTGNDSTFLSGTHYAGASVRTGDGQFVWDLTKVSALNGESYGGTLTCDYDNRDGVDLLVSVDDFTEDGVTFASWDTAYRRGVDAGDFQYRTHADLTDPADGEEEDLSIRTRWIPGQGGRGDAVVSGGTAGDLVFHWTQCWDASHTLVYQWDDAGYTQQVGDVGDCPYGSFAEVDRI